MILAACVAASLRAFFFATSESGPKPAKGLELTEATFHDVHQATGFEPDFAAAARGVVCMRLIA